MGATGSSNPSMQGAVLHWNDGFLLGFAPMDETHQEFVECVAALQQCDEAALPEMLAAFERHAVAHFEQEEQWMQRTAFPAASARACQFMQSDAVLSSMGSFTRSNPQMVSFPL